MLVTVLDCVQDPSGYVMLVAVYSSTDNKASAVKQYLMLNHTVNTVDSDSNVH